MQTYTLADIRRMCLEYDKKSGRYPESTYEGQSVYEFMLKKLTGRAYKGKWIEEPQRSHGMVVATKDGWKDQTTGEALVAVVSK